MFESVWDLKHDHRTITFVSGFLVTRFGKEPLLPSEVPDRHKRLIRNMGVMVFKTKPFRGLKLHPPLFDNTLVIAERRIGEKESRLFANEQDAELWKLQTDNAAFSTRRTTPQKTKYLFESKVTTPQVIRSAQENSFSIRYEYVRLIEQVTMGLAAIKRIMVLKERGLDQEMLDYIWGSVFGKSESPLRVDSISTKMKKMNELLAK